MAFEVETRSEDISLSINPKRKFRCSKGHQWEDTGRTEMSVWVLGKAADTFSFCPFCYIDFFKQHITPAEEIKEADNGF